MKLPRFVRPALAGALLLASSALEELGRRIAPQDDATPPPRPSPPPREGYSVALSPEAQSMIAQSTVPTVVLAEPEPLAGSIEARRRAGAL